MISPPETDPLNYPNSERSRVRLLPKRGSSERDLVHCILDAAPLCFVGYTIGGQPYVTPTTHWRDGNRIYWHGSSASRFLRQVANQPVCVTCALLDGYVLARSAFKHSVNYRSVMVFGTARLIGDLPDRQVALERLVEHLFPGRWPDLRAMKRSELAATSVLWMEIEEAAAKVRTGPPSDMNEPDVRAWTGIIPLRHVALDPVPDTDAERDPPSLGSLPSGIVPIRKLSLAHSSESDSP